MGLKRFMRRTFGLPHLLDDEDNNTPIKSVIGIKSPSRDYVNTFTVHRPDGIREMTNIKCNIQDDKFKTKIDEIGILLSGGRYNDKRG